MSVLAGKGYSMPICPICKSSVGSDTICPNCKFDLSLDYEHYPTLMPSVGKHARLLSRRRNLYELRSHGNPFFCPECGGKDFLYFAETGNLACNNCGTEVPLAPAQTIAEFSDGMVPLNLLDPELKLKFKTLNRRGIRSISAGCHYYLAAKEDGTVLVNSDAKENPIKASEWENIKNAVASWDNVSRVYARDNAVSAIRADGSFLLNNSVMTTDATDKKILSLAFADEASHPLALTVDGKILINPKNVLIKNNYPYVDELSGWNGLCDISAGAKHFVALRRDHAVLAIGSNERGQCDVSSWKDVIAISAGSWHTLGLKSDGTVLATGDNSEGQLNVSSLSSVVALSSGSMHSVFLKSDGTVVAIGQNNCGQLEVTKWRDVVAVSANSDYTIGLRADGAILTTDQKR